MVGTAYYDSTTEKTYKCTVANSLNYADATYFEAISNNDLLLKLQNLKIGSGYGTTDKAINFNKPIKSIVAIHIGNEPVTVIIKQGESNLNTGKVTFRSSYNQSVEIYYIAVFA